MKFSQLGLTSPLVRAVTKAGHAAPTPIQALAIPEALSGRDILGAAEAGTGKTAAFALPLLQRLSQSSPPKHPLSRRIRALVVTANRDLAVQIGKEFATYGRYSDTNCLTFVEGTPGSSLAGGVRSVDVLITTPELLLNLHQHGGVDLRAVEILVIDEADRMLDLGKIQDVQRIISQLPLDRQTLLFTATLPTAINCLADNILRTPARIRIPPTQKAAVLVQQSVCFVGRPQKTSLLVAWLGARSTSRTVVFTRTRQGADRVVRQLLSCGIRAEAIHGEKPLQARQQTLVRFRSTDPPVLVATDLAARGIDVETIARVVNYDLPLEPETYVHRIGRIVRAGHKGVSVTFCDESERPLLKGIERLLRREIPIDDKTVPFDRLPRTKLSEGESLPSDSATPPRSTSRSRRSAAVESHESPKASSESNPAPSAGRVRSQRTKVSEPAEPVAKVRAAANQSRAGESRSETRLTPASAKAGSKTGAASQRSTAASEQPKSKNRPMPAATRTVAKNSVTKNSAAKSSSRPAKTGQVRDGAVSRDKARDKTREKTTVAATRRPSAKTGSAQASGGKATASKLGARTATPKRKSEPAKKGAVAAKPRAKSANRKR